MIGVGPQLPQPDPRGWLVFQWLPLEVQRLEDSRQMADFEEADNHRGMWARPWTRPATATERALLEHLGHTVPAELTTTIDYSAGIRRRRWLQLEGSTP